MRCNPSYWLLGIVPIAMLSWVAVQLEHESIETELTRRSEDALKRVGFGWAKLQFSGRDGFLAGKAADEQEPGRALASVGNVWGVRIADNRSELIARVADYRWSATVQEGGRVRLSGDVPSDEARRTLLGRTQAAFPGAAVLDEMRLARGDIDRDTWMTAASFTLRNLAELKRGEAELAMLNLSISGEAKTSEAYRIVRTELAKQRPTGVRLVREKITPPVAKPYIWMAKKGSGGVLISGYAPSDEDRDRFAARAKSLFGNVPISDRADIADGEPDGLSKAVNVVLEQLAQLRSGEAEFSDRDLVFSGEAADEQTATQVKRTLKLDVPQNFKIVDQIRFPRPELVAPGSGYVMGIVNDGSAIEVIGMVPSEAAKAALVDAVKARFPGREVTDKTQVAPGAPDGWQQCVVAGLASLPKLKLGKSILSNRKLEVSGQTDDYAASQSIPGDVKAAAGQTCEATTNVAFTGKMKTDLTWHVLREPNGLVTIDGEAPDEESRQRLLEMAQQIYAGSSISDRMHIVGATPEPWLSAAHLGLQQLARLHDGDVSIDGNTLTIKGMAESQQLANDIRSVLTTDLPPGFKGNDQITIMSANEKAANSCQNLMRQATAKGTINFERAKADLTPDSTQTLKDLVQIANACPGFNIRIEGHTDSEGTDERNQRLSDRRARAVADFLGQNGVDARRLTTIGYGATRPIADNGTADGRAKNRRIEFTVSVN